MKKKLAVFVVLAGLTVLSAVTVAAQPMWGQGPGPGWRGGYGWGPTDKVTLDLRQKLWQVRQAIWAEMSQAKPDQAKVLSLTKQMNDLQSRLVMHCTQWRLKNPQAARAYGGWGPGYGRWGRRW